MMWSNFFLQEENRRRGAAARRRARGQPKAQMTPEREGKIKLALLLTSVGATLAVLAVGTEFWVELNTYRDNGSAVCDAAHLGLWKMCTKRLWQADVPAGRDTCGPAELPGGEAAARPARGLGPPQAAERLLSETAEPQRGRACTLRRSPPTLPTSACAPGSNSAPGAHPAERESVPPN